MVQRNYRERLPKPRTGVVVLIVALIVAILALSSASAENPATKIADSLPCGAVIGGQRALRNGQSPVFGRVALTTGRALQANRSGDPDPAASLFAKDGLLIRPGASFELIVPRAWRGRLSIGWGSPAIRTEHLVVSCPHDGARPSREWLAYAGGYWVREAACVPLIVKVAKKKTRVHVGVGAPCRGQDEPPAGS